MASNDPCEVIGFSGANALLMPFAIGRRAPRLPRGGAIGAGAVRPSPAGSAALSTPWASRSTARGRCWRDRRLYLPQLAAACACPQPRRGAARSRCARAQYLHHLLPRPAHGDFSGSGVGKSVLLSMLARNVTADVNVIGLIGERGREVQEFLSGRSGRGGTRPLGRRGLHLRRAGADAPPGRPRDARYRRIFPRRRSGRARAHGFGHALCHGAAQDAGGGGGARASRGRPGGASAPARRRWRPRRPSGRVPALARSSEAFYLGRPRSPISPMTVTSALTLRASIESSTDLPTPSRENPTTLAAAAGDEGIDARTPRSSGAPTRRRTCASGGALRKA